VLRSPTTVSVTLNCLMSCGIQKTSPVKPKTVAQ
jgi:hypothetical protein